MFTSHANVTLRPNDGERVMQVEVITLAFLCPTLLGGLPFVGPAFDSALEDIKVLYPGLNFTQTIVSTNRAGCSYPDWMDIYEDVLAEFYFKSDNNRRKRFDLTTFVISGGDEGLCVQKFASALNKLMISSVAPIVNGLAPYSTWVTASVISFTTYSKVYEGLLRMYNWTNIVITNDLMPGSNPFYKLAADFLAKYLQELPLFKVQVTLLRVNSGTFSPFDYIELMRNTSEHSRGFGVILTAFYAIYLVVFYFGATAPIQNMLVAADKLNMTNGEYVFLGITPFWFPSAFGIFRWIGDNATSEVAKSAFKCFLLLENLNEAESQNSTLYLQWRRMSKERYNYTYSLNDPLTPHPSQTYSAMMSLAEVISELHDHGESDILSDGRRLARQFANRTFSLRAGKLRFNEYRENVPYMMITQTNAETLKKTMILLRDAESGQLESTGPVEWPAVWPVPNEPICGFSGNALICLENNSGAYETVQYGASFGAALAVICLSVFVLYLVKFGNHYSDGWWQLQHNLDMSTRKRNVINTQQSSKIGRQFENTI